MANVYSTNFFCSHAGAPSSYQCPAGFRAVLRCITVFNANTVEQMTGHVIHTPSDCTIFQWRMGPATVVEGSEAVTQLLHFVFSEGEGIYCSNDGWIDMTCSGFLLTLP